MNILRRGAFIGIIIVSFAFLTEVTSIRCFECNSRNNSACIDLDKHLRDDEHLYRAGLRLIDCETALPSLPNAHNVRYFCRKMVQTILHPGHDSDVRVTRTCGYVPHHRPCYTADNEDHLEVVCQCFEDGCNGGQLLSNNLILLTIMTFGLSAIKTLS